MNDVLLCRDGPSLHDRCSGPAKHKHIVSTAAAFAVKTKLDIFMGHGGEAELKLKEFSQLILKTGKFDNIARDYVNHLDAGGVSNPNINV